MFKFFDNNTISVSFRKQVSIAENFNATLYTRSFSSLATLSSYQESIIDNINHKLVIFFHSI